MKRTGKLYKLADIRKAAKEVRPTEIQIESVIEWARLMESGKLSQETHNYLNFGQYVLKGILGYGSVLHEEDRVDFTVNDDEGNPVMVVECKDTTVDLDKRQPRKQEHSTPMKQVWDYMGTVDVEWGMCTNYRFFRLVKKSSVITKYHEIDFKSLYDENGADITKVAEFIAVFRGIVQEGDADIGSGGEAADKEMADAFYGLYRDARAMMIKEFESRGAQRINAVDAAQVFLNRIIFLFFAESRDLVRGCLFDKQLKQLDNRFPDDGTDVICSGVQNDLFRVLNDGYSPYRIPRFNGGLFKDTVPNHSMTFSDYRQHEWFRDVANPRTYSCRRVKAALEKHPKLNPIICNLIEMHDYDFNTEIDVNMLGHVFEQSIQELDDLRADGTSTRKAEGIYYTPSYVVDFICRNTIMPYLSLDGKAETSGDLVMEYASTGSLPVLEQKLRRLRVLDPSCGSGAFLAGAASLLLEIYEEIHDTKVLARTFMTKSGLIALDEWSEEAAMRRIVRDNIYGVDKDAQSTKIAQLAMFLLTASKNEPLPDTSDHIIAGNSIISDRSVVDDPVDWETSFPNVFSGDDPGFDIIIGNPPYGADLDDSEKKYLGVEFKLGSSNTAPIFIHQSLRLLRGGGVHSFIVPKSLMYSSNEWAKTREKITPGMTLMANMGKVWKNVKLEQCIYVVHDNTETASFGYHVNDGDTIRRLDNLNKDALNAFGAFPSIHDETELSLGLKLSAMPKLAGRVSNTRGTGMFTKDIGTKGTPLVGGKQVQAFHVDGLKGYVDESLIKENGRLVECAVLAQNIVAHKINPSPHIRITATIADEFDFAISDTVNQLVPVDSSMSHHFLLGLLSSRVINWYVYKFLLSEAIRTIHFDSPITNRIPVRMARASDVELCVKKLLECGGHGDLAVSLYDEIDAIFYDVFGLNNAEIKLVKKQTW